MPPLVPGKPRQASHITLQQGRLDPLNQRGRLALRILNGSILGVLRGAPPKRPFLLRVRSCARGSLLTLSLSCISADVLHNLDPSQ